MELDLPYLAAYVRSVVTQSFSAFYKNCQLCGDACSCSEACDLETWPATTCRDLHAGVLLHRPWRINRRQRLTASSSTRLTSSVKRTHCHYNTNSAETSFPIAAVYMPGRRPWQKPWVMCTPCRVLESVRMFPFLPSRSDEFIQLKDPIDVEVEFGVVRPHCWLCLVFFLGLKTSPTNQKVLTGRAFQFGQKSFDSILATESIFFRFHSIRQSDKFAACTLIFK